MSRVFEIVTPDGSRHFSDTDLPLAIGSGGDAQIQLLEKNDRKASAWLAESRGYLFLQAAEDGEPVYHNNEHLQSSSTWIKSGDSTRIGSTLLDWVIAGDRVEVRLRRTDDNVLTPPPVIPGDSGVRKTLPRVRPPARQPGRKRLLTAVGTLFLLLVLATVFVLTAQRFEPVIRPQPESLRVSGFPPAIKIGHTFLALAGTYTLEAEKTGYFPLSEQIVIPGDGEKSTKEFTLKKLPGLVDIRSRPVDGADVSVDEKPVGKTPLSGLELAGGSHLLRVEKERYIPREQLLEVTGAGVLQSVVVDLQPGWGTVVLRSEPAGATVSLDNRDLGRTPLTVELMAGVVQLVFGREGFSDVKLELAVVAGRQLEPEPVRLVPAPARVLLRSDPSGAMILLGQTFAGTTPVTLNLPSGTPQKIRLQLSGHEPVTLKRSFQPGSEQKITVSLKPVYGTILLVTDPVDATLLIDGRAHGPATGRLRLTTREHRLTVRARGFEDATRIIVPEKGVSRQVEIRLRKKGEGAATVSSLPVNRNKKMIDLGPATVRMGAARREPGRRANEQERTVELARPFELAGALVTNGEFRRFKPAHRSGTVGRFTLDGDKQPVVNVSWQDAARYCNWLSRQQGLPAFYRAQGKTMVAVRPFNTGYRLPTEAEWAFAARMAGRKNRARYPWPGKFPPRIQAGNFGDESARGLLAVVIRDYNDGFAVTSPVGSFPKNPAGFFDLGGNVSQWCHDWYTPYAGIGEQKIRVDTMGPGSGTHHVVRGSSWRDATITSLRLSYRGYSKVAKDDIGFRVARYVR